MDSAMEIKIKRLSKKTALPKYAHSGDAGMDLYSLEDKILKSGERYNFSLGIAIEIPQNYVGLIWERSGLATREGVISLGGVIDSGYRGEIIVALWNLSRKTVKISQGERIAQLLIQPAIQAKIKQVKNLSETKRGANGFGSTGR